MYHGPTFLYQMQIKYVSGSYDTPEGFQALDKAISEHEFSRNSTEGSSRRLFYLALPPSVYPPVCKMIKSHCMNKCMYHLWNQFQVCSFSWIPFLNNYVAKGSSIFINTSIQSTSLLSEVERQCCLLQFSFMYGDNRKPLSFPTWHACFILDTFIILSCNYIQLILGDGLVLLLRSLLERIWHQLRN